MIHSIDRLGRNYEEIIAQWRIITKEKGAQVVVQDMPLLDTRAGAGSYRDADRGYRAEAPFLCCAEGTENIRQRQAEGIAAAAARRPLWAARKPIPGEFPACTRCGRKTYQRPGGCAQAPCYARHIF